MPDKLQLDDGYLEQLFTARPADILDQFGRTGNCRYAYQKGDVPILLVAHADTVFKEPSAPAALCRSPLVWCAPLTGLGADDRVGVYIVSKLAEQLNCSLLITDEEEIGGLGASEFVKDYAEQCEDDFLAIIEYDRRRSNDAVFYDCDNIDFIAAVTKEYYKEAAGSFSDISIIAPALNTAAVNLSCGYVGEHMQGEYLVIPWMLKSMSAGASLIRRLADAGKKYEYCNADARYAEKNDRLWGRYQDYGYFDYGRAYTHFKRHDYSKQAKSREAELAEPAVKTVLHKPVSDTPSNIVPDIALADEEERIDEIEEEDYEKLFPPDRFYDTDDDWEDDLEDDWDMDQLYFVLKQFEPDDYWGRYNCLRTNFGLSKFNAQRLLDVIEARS
jgi:hypothetical protein